MSPRTTEQLLNLKAARKDEILMAALKLFSSQGFQNTSMDAIAKKVAISKGSLYNYFKNKEALLNEVVVLGLKDAMKIGDQLLEKLEGVSDEELFKQLLNSYFSTLKEHKEIWQLTISLAVQMSYIPSVQQSIQLVYNKLIEQMEKLFIFLGSDNPKVEALLFGALVDGVSIQYLVFGEEYPFQEIQEMIIKKYIK